MHPHVHFFLENLEYESCFCRNITHYKQIIDMIIVDSQNLIIFCNNNNNNNKHGVLWLLKGGVRTRS